MENKRKTAYQGKVVANTFKISNQEGSQRHHALASSCVNMVHMLTYLHTHVHAIHTHTIKNVFVKKIIISEVLFQMEIVYITKGVNV